jgi:two-component system alkaline phosphatase synthesis response regulator PhoP
VIFVTAQAGVSDRIEGIDLGAVDYVTKPFSSPELLARVEVALRLRRREQARLALEGA